MLFLLSLQRVRQWGHIIESQWPHKLLLRITWADQCTRTSTSILLPPGFRFKPTDQELIDHYLWNKISKRCLPPNRIRDVDLYKFNPQQLFETYKIHGEDELYFFTLRKKRYANGTRPNRNTGDGWWKASGGDRPICSKGRVVGYKKSLVFYEKNARDGYQRKTNWLMQEYTVKLQNTPSRARGDMKLDDLVLCKIYQTRVTPKHNPQQDNGEVEPDKIVVNAALQPHFSQYSMFPLLQSRVNNMINDVALPQVVDVCPSDCVMGEREHVKSCNFEVEDWIDWAQLNITTYGESSDVMLDLLWSED